jgi:RNA polymerase sigma-70 factor (ECF subfamily)
MEIARAVNRVRGRAAGRGAADAGSLDVSAAYDQHAGPLYRYLLGLLSSAEEAEDALQEVFLGLLRRPKSVPIADLRAYLFRAARNQAIQALRRRRAHACGASISWVDPGACAPEERALAIDVDRALTELPVEQREVVVLKLSEGLTFAEISAVLGIPASTAASRYRLGLARLRNLLEGGARDD